MVFAHRAHTWRARANSEGCAGALRYYKLTQDKEDREWGWRAELPKFEAGWTWLPVWQRHRRGGVICRGKSLRVKLPGNEKDS